MGGLMCLGMSAKLLAFNQAPTHVDHSPRWVCEVLVDAAGQHCMLRARRSCTVSLNALTSQSSLLGQRQAHAGSTFSTRVTWTEHDGWYARPVAILESAEACADVIRVAAKRACAAQFVRTDDVSTQQSAAGVGSEIGYTTLGDLTHMTDSSSCCDECTHAVRLTCSRGVLDMDNSLHNLARYVIEAAKPYTTLEVGASPASSLDTNSHILVPS